MAAARDISSDPFAAVMGAGRGRADVAETLFAHLMPADIAANRDERKRIQGRVRKRMFTCIKDGDYQPVLDELSSGMLGLKLPANEQWGDCGVLKWMAPRLTTPFVEAMGPAIDALQAALGVAPVTESDQRNRQSQLRTRAHVHLRAKALAPALHDHVVGVDEATELAQASAWSQALRQVAETADKFGDKALTDAIGPREYERILHLGDADSARQLIKHKAWAEAAEEFSRRVADPANPTADELVQATTAARARISFAATTAAGARSSR